MRALPHISLLELGALAAARACAGGATFVGHDSVAGATTPLDHYLCAPSVDAGCRSVAVTLPDGTTAAVGDPNGRLRCISRRSTRSA